MRGGWMASVCNTTGLLLVLVFSLLKEYIYIYLKEKRYANFRMTEIQLEDLQKNNLQ